VSGGTSCDMNVQNFRGNSSKSVNKDAMEGTKNNVEQR
jgi:hypothetical protein